ncbi:MAG: 16S rRNA (cytidine(1402)-2'-O)-methyltransferase [Myxococcota bacterium]
MSGTLYVVSTPIGDPADLTIRAREVLSTVDRIAAEDTRVALRLLRQLGVTPPVLVSYHDHNETDRAAELAGWLARGERIAVISDAGTPSISDPGYRIVRAAVERGIPVVVVPGACAAVAALSGSGLATDRFVFLGFLPRDEGPRAAALQARRFETATLVLYEAPHRILDTLRAIGAAWGDRPAALARNLTKTYEQWHRGTVGAIAASLGEDETRGEMTLVVGGFDGRAELEDHERVDRLIHGLVRAGVPVAVVRDVVAEVYDRPRREIYQQALAARGDPEEAP